jgi:BlaI family transcriptional regulator, penicillinase repressor
MKISESESQVMEVLWRDQPLTSGEIVERISRVEDWSPKTVRTLLDRLVAKGALVRHKRDRVYSYECLIGREQWLRDQAGQLVDNHCQGRLAPLVAAFASREKLTDADRREILDLLEGMK